MKDRCKVLESGAVSAGHVGVDYGRGKRSLSEMDASVLLVGGFDGCSWLSKFDCYSPSRDIIKSLCSMTFARSYASAAKFNNELFIFGGVDGDVWYDTGTIYFALFYALKNFYDFSKNHFNKLIYDFVVESYNLATDQWVNRPSLNKKKGSLAGASLCNKLFAIGGGDGIDCFSEVETFDQNVGRWMYTEAMQHKVF